MHLLSGAVMFHLILKISMLLFKEGHLIQSQRRRESVCAAFFVTLRTFILKLLFK